MRTDCATWPSIIQQSFNQEQGHETPVPPTLADCGFTRQYAGLEALYARHRDQGLVVLGFPSNDFSQESSSNQEIADFCDNTFGVTCPMFVKSGVTGNTATEPKDPAVLKDIEEKLSAK